MRIPAQAAGRLHVQGVSLWGINGFEDVDGQVIAVTVLIDTVVFDFKCTRMDSRIIVVTVKVSTAPGIREIPVMIGIDAGVRILKKGVGTGNVQQAIAIVVIRTDSAQIEGGFLQGRFQLVDRHFGSGTPKQGHGPRYVGRRE